MAQRICYGYESLHRDAYMRLFGLLKQNGRSGIATSMHIYVLRSVDQCLLLKERKCCNMAIKNVAKSSRSRASKMKTRLQNYASLTTMGISPCPRQNIFMLMKTILANAMHDNDPRSIWKQNIPGAFKEPCIQLFNMPICPSVAKKSYFGDLCVTMFSVVLAFMTRASTRRFALDP